MNTNRNLIFIELETTGTEAGSNFMLQLAYLILDESGQPLKQNRYFRFLPNAFDDLVDASAQAHQISYNMLSFKGLPIDNLFKSFFTDILVHQVGTIASCNLSTDLAVLQTEIKRQTKKFAHYQKILDNLTQIHVDKTSPQMKQFHTYVSVANN